MSNSHFVHGCGRCSACRINSRDVWADRLIAESREHSATCVVALSYADPIGPTLVGPPASISPDLSRSDCFKFLDALRLKLAEQGRKLRFHLLADYGEQMFRPHYHVMLFGEFGCLRGRTSIERLRTSEGCCDWCRMVSGVWRRGDIYAIPFDGSAAMARYNAQHQLKRMEFDQNPALRDRVPPFQLMSRRPALGHGLAVRVADAYRELEANGVKFIDIPSYLHSGKSSRFNLGRTNHATVRKLLGRPKGLPVSVQIAKSHAMRLWRTEALSKFGSVSARLSLEGEAASARLEFERSIKAARKFAKNLPDGVR